MGRDPASSSDIHPVTFKSSDLESQVWRLIGTDTSLLSYWFPWWSLEEF